MGATDVEQALARIRVYLSRVPVDDPLRTRILKQLVDSARLFTVLWTLKDQVQAEAWLRRQLEGLGEGASGQ